MPFGIMTATRSPAASPRPSSACPSRSVSSSNSAKLTDRSGSTRAGAAPNWRPARRIRSAICTSRFPRQVGAAQARPAAGQGPRAALGQLVQLVGPGAGIVPLHPLLVQVPVGLGQYGRGELPGPAVVLVEVDPPGAGCPQPVLGRQAG